MLTHFNRLKKSIEKNISKCLDNILKTLRTKFKNNLELYLCYLFELFTFIFRIN